MVALSSSSKFSRPAPTWSAWTFSDSAEPWPHRAAISRTRSASRTSAAAVLIRPVSFAVVLAAPEPPLRADLASPLAPSSESCPCKTVDTRIPERRPVRDTASSRSLSTGASGSSGTGLVTPPSMISRPPTSAGVTTLGIANEARTATSAGPLLNHTSRRALRSVPTAVNGSCMSSIRMSSSISPITDMILLARIAPPPAKDGSSSRRTSRWDSPRTHSSKLSSLPDAYSDPTTAPIDAPETPTTSCPRASSSRITPMCA